VATVHPEEDASLPFPVLSFQPEELNADASYQAVDPVGGSKVCAQQAAIRKAGKRDSFRCREEDIAEFKQLVVAF